MVCFQYTSPQKQRPVVLKVIWLLKSTVQTALQLFGGHVFKPLYFEWCLGTVEVSRTRKEQIVQCQKQIVWLQVSLFVLEVQPASLQLEIPTWDIKLRTVLPSKQQGGMETAVQLSRSHEGFRKSGFRRSSTTISRLHSHPLKMLSLSQSPRAWLQHSHRLLCLQPLSCLGTL